MKNKNVGFVLIKMTNTSLYDSILYTIKEFINNNPFNQYVVFNSYCDKIQTLNIPILHLHQAQFFDGSLILFDLPSIILSKTFPNITDRLYYATDVSWAKSPTTNYQEWQSIYMQDNLNILAANQDIYNLYSICWQKPLGVAERFDYETISQYL